MVNSWVSLHFMKPFQCLKLLLNILSYKDFLKIVAKYKKLYQLYWASHQRMISTMNILVLPQPLSPLLKSSPQWETLFQAHGTLRMNINRPLHRDSCLHSQLEESRAWYSLKVSRQRHSKMRRSLGASEKGLVRIWRLWRGLVLHTYLLYIWWKLDTTYSWRIKGLNKMPFME